VKPQGSGRLTDTVSVDTHHWPAKLLKCKVKTSARQELDAKALCGGRPYGLISLGKLTARQYLCQPGIYTGVSATRSDRWAARFDDPNQGETANLRLAGGTVEQLRGTIIEISY